MPIAARTSSSRCWRTSCAIRSRRSRAGIEILKRKGIDPAIAERITATMSRQAAQLVRLIDDLLDVSRISSGRLELRKAPVALADIMRDAVATVRPLLDRMGHELIVDVPTEPVVLDADAARLAQVLANLLNNAARYTPSGGRIELSATACARTWPSFGFRTTATASTRARCRTYSRCSTRATTRARRHNPA